MKKTTAALLVAATLLGACANDPEAANEDGSNVTTDVVSGDDSPRTTEASGDEPGATTATVGDERLDLEIVDYGYSEMPKPEYSDSISTTWAFVLRNPNTGPQVARYVSVEVSFYDAAGAVLKSEDAVFESILPGQTVAHATSTSIAGVAEMKVQARADDWEDADVELGAFTSGPPNLVPTEYGSTDISGEITSTFAADQESIEVAVVLRDGADGPIMGGNFTYVDFVPANGTATYTTSVNQAVPAGWVAEAYAS